MKIVPVIRSSDLEKSLHFYTKVLDFAPKWPGNEHREMANGVIDLVRDGAELQLSRHSGDGVFGSVNRVFVEDVGERYKTLGGALTHLRLIGSLPYSCFRAAPIPNLLKN